MSFLNEVFEPESKMDAICESNLEFNMNLDLDEFELTQPLTNTGLTEPKPPTSQNYNFLISLTDSLDSIKDPRKLLELKAKMLSLIKDYV